MAFRSPPPTAAAALAGDTAAHSSVAQRIAPLLLTATEHIHTHHPAANVSERNMGKSSLATLPLAVMGMVLLACSTSGGLKAVDQASPEGLLRAYLTFVSAGDESAASALVATRDELSTVLDCSENAGPLGLPEQYRYRESIREEVRQAKAQQAILSLTKLDSPKKEEELGVGSDWHGCRARATVLLQKTRVYYRVESPRGENEEDTDVKLIRIEGRWFFRQPFKPKLI